MSKFSIKGLVKKVWGMVTYVPNKIFAFLRKIFKKLWPFKKTEQSEVVEELIAEEANKFGAKEAAQLQRTIKKWAKKHNKKEGEFDMVTYAEKHKFNVNEIYNFVQEE